MINYMFLLLLSNKFHTLSCNRISSCIIFFLLGIKNPLSFSKFFLKLKENGSDSKMTQTGVIQIYTDSELYLIPTTSSSIESLAKNYSFWLENRYKYSFLNYDMACHIINDNKYYTIELMKKIDLAFDSYDLKVDIEIEELFFKGIEREIDQAKSALYQLPKIHPKFINEFFEVKENSGKVGFLHGDFHIGNVMMKGEEPMLIDLDRAKKIGPVELDHIHFKLVQLQVEKHIFWLDELEQYFKSNVNSHLSSYNEDMVKLYLLYRVYFELNSSNKWLSKKLINFFNTIEGLVYDK